MQIEMFQKNPWIAVDLDGTLAHWDGLAAEIGEPIQLMMDRVKAWMAVGLKVKIFTARAAEGAEQIQLVRDWLTKHGLAELEITNSKDKDMVEMWDDRSVAVVRNTGVGIRQHYS